MKKPLLVTTLAVAIAATAYLATSRNVGMAISDEVARFETNLAQLDGVVVYRMDYERRQFDGTLHYDIALRPVPGEPLHQRLVELLGEDADLDVRFDGSVAVKHGPWLGGGAGFGLARMQGGAALPPALREMLPQYPGQRPMLDVAAIIGFDRKAAVTLTAIDYRGKVVDGSDDAGADLTLAGLTAQLGFDAQVDWLKADVRLNELGLALPDESDALAAVRGLSMIADLNRDAAGFWNGPAALKLDEFTLSSNEGNVVLSTLTANSETRTVTSADGQPTLALTARAGIASIGGNAVHEDGNVRIDATTFDMSLDIVREWTSIWIGDSSMKLAELKASDSERSVQLSALAINAQAARDGALVNQRVDYETGPITVNGSTLPGGKVSVVIDGLRGEVLDEFVIALERLGNDASGAEGLEALAALRTSGQRLLSETLTLSLDPIGLHVEQENDINGRIVLRFAGSPDATLDDWPDLLARIELDAGFSAATAALKTLSRLALEHDRNSSGLDTDAAELAAAVETQFQQLMTEAEQTPFLIVTPDNIRAAASFKDGVLTINGERVDGIDPISMLAGLSGAVPNATGAASATAELDADAPPLFGSVTLSSDFAPDPHVLELIAGGDVSLDGALGNDCIGYVNPAQPDVVLNYTTGLFKLFVYAESDADVTLVINAPDGSWQCNDDGPGRGLDPTVEFPDAPTGRYSIWVGTIDATPANTRLMFSEINPGDE